ncbi:MAG TPA: pyruvoyl-dependent arginine decarboxylase [Thermomicrobiales bacterium]|nr:pyruvoyl-dependent arginine decarboxylase [Thermomicrobiales bacterium]
MKIRVVAAVGRGQTLLSSFDDALYRCGVHNYNLLALSSVIPPGSQIEEAGCHAPPTDEHGDRLYVVKAEARSDQADEAVAAGIGWYQWGDGRGLFVEHEVTETCPDCARAQVALLIRLSLYDLCQVRGIPFDARRVGMMTISEAADGQPTTALVVAVFQSERWTAASTNAGGR